MTRARRQLTDYATAYELTLTFFDPAETFDPAIVGIVVGYGQEPAVVYDETRALAGLMRDGMDADEAREWMDVNTQGSYFGPTTPRFLIRLKDLP